MLNKIKQIVQDQFQEVFGLRQTAHVRFDKRYQPDRPIGFVSRSDPNFYFLSRR